ncbi:unnamed protein product [Discosporangium mesarthrocarpum]
MYIPEGPWLAPCLYHMVANIRKLAKEADGGFGVGSSAIPSGIMQSYSEAEPEEEGGKCMVVTTHIIMKAFRISINDRRNEPSESRKACALHLAVDMFKHYSDLRNLRMCNNIRGVLTQHWDAVRPMASKGDLVAYHYYTGLLKLSEDKYRDAEDDLEYALRHCHRAARRNKRRILDNLIPLRLRQGRYPSRSLLDKYNLLHYYQFSSAISNGDVHSFNSLMETWERTFITKGTYLLMEKCLLLVYRNLVKKM